tara:strand:- start:3603 stop:4307 length:705 start_codon:yes stop_codon:yes gene_type:complete
MVGFKNPKKIKRLFNKISYKYDLLNNLLSLGMHKLWKKKLIDLLKPKKGEHWADLCCGTGDMAFLLDNLVAPDGFVIGFDMAYEIIKVAKEKSNKFPTNSISWITKDIFEIDHTANKFDGICMSYGLRNLDNIEKGIKKVYLMLKKEGRAGFLDFNRTKNNSYSSIFQRLFLRCVVVPISGIFNLKDEYAYIEKSISIFPEGKDLITISKKIGFKKVKYQEIFAGQMGLLLVQK